MLVLSRKANEEIVIKGTILIKVLSIGRSKVKLGISAPEDVSIVRRELSHPPLISESRVRPPRRPSLPTPSQTGLAKRAG